MLLVTRRERRYARGPATPSHHAAAVQDHPRVGWPSARATRQTSTRGGAEARQGSRHNTTP
jgi:hypothetical protein